MKKILFALNDNVYPFNVGGMEVFNYYLIDALKDKFDITYLSTHPLNISGLKFIRIFNIKPTKILIPIQTLIFLLFNPSIKKVIISFSSAHWITWHIYSLINTLLGREYYVVIHYGKTVPKEAHSHYKNFFVKAKKVIAVSNDIKKNYEKEYGINCTVLYPLVPFYNSGKSKETLRREYGIDIDAKVICMVGSIKKMKNPDTLMTAVSKFSESELQEYNIHVVYAGSGSMLNSLKEEAKNSGLSNRIHFLGFVSKEKVNEIFELSDIYVIASDFEGTSVSLLEAMFNKKIILAADSPGINDMVKHKESALLFKTRDADELKIHLLTAMCDKSALSDMRHKAYDFYSENYNYTDIINAYIKFLEE